MTRLIPLAVAAALLALPASAQEAAPEDAPSLLEQGARDMMEGLLQELRPGVEALPGLTDELLDQMQPGLDQLSGLGAELLPIFQTLAQEMGPAIVEIAGQIDSIANYEPPVLLPNGDIVLRRKSDAPAWVPPGDRPSGNDPGAPGGTEL